jgi:nicotinate phosphoribosyltransferase
VYKRQVLRHPTDHTKSRLLNPNDVSQVEPLLVEVLAQGKRVEQPCSIEEMRALCQQDLERLDPGVRRIMTPHIYHVSLTQGLWDLKQELIREARAEE